MKRFFFALAIVAMALSASAQNFRAYSGAQATSYVGGTNKAMALTTNAFFTIDVPKAEYVSLFADFKYLNAVGSGDVNGLRIDLYRGIDSATFETNAWTTWVITAGTTTTTPNSQMTNINVGGVGFLRAKIANVSTNAHGTNITVSYGFKN